MTSLPLPEEEEATTAGGGNPTLTNRDREVGPDPVLIEVDEQGIAIGEPRRLNSIPEEAFGSGTGQLEVIQEEERGEEEESATAGAQESSKEIKDEQEVEENSKGDGGKKATVGTQESQGERADEQEDKQRNEAGNSTVGTQKSEEGQRDEQRKDEPEVEGSHEGEEGREEGEKVVTPKVQVESTPVNEEEKTIKLSDVPTIETSISEGDMAPPEVGCWLFWHSCHG